MNKRINELNLQLAANRVNSELIREKIQKEYDTVFNDLLSLKKAISNAESASQYQGNEAGEIESWYYFPGLSDFLDCREYFENWLSEHHCMFVDWKNECLLFPQGESIIIQDDCRHKSDNGVWLNHKQIIEETEYLDDSGQVNEAKRNELIESYMEKSGFFPGVFRVDNYGNVSYIKTK